MSGCGCEWKDWTAHLRKFIETFKQGGKLEKCDDSVERVPAYVTVLCLDSLNGIPQRYANKMDDAGLHLFQKDATKNGEILDLLETLSLFKSVIYVQTADHKRWDMATWTDDIANYIAEQAKVRNIPPIKSQWLWDLIGGYQRPTNAYHHSEGENEPGGLTYQWDKFIFRLVCFAKT